MSIRRIRILSRSLEAPEVAALVAFATEAGFSAEEIEVTPVVGDPLTNCDDEIILVTLSAVAPDAGLDDELKKIQNGARRAICVWQNEIPAKVKIPIAATKYAYSIIPRNVEKLRAVVADDDILYFETPDGQPIPKVDTERNLCVDENAKPK